MTNDHASQSRASATRRSSRSRGAAKNQLPRLVLGLGLLAATSALPVQNLLDEMRDTKKALEEMKASAEQSLQDAEELQSQKKALAQALGSAQELAQSTREKLFSRSRSSHPREPVKHRAHFNGTTLNRTATARHLSDAVVVIGELPWSHYIGKCVSNHNLIKYEDYDLAACAAACLNYAPGGCEAFEYGVDHGATGSGAYNPRDCQLQSSANPGDCDGSEYNLDLYAPLKPPNQRTASLKERVAYSLLEWLEEQTGVDASTPLDRALGALRWRESLASSIEFAEYDQAVQDATGMDEEAFNNVFAGRYRSTLCASGTVWPHDGNFDVRLCCASECGHCGTVNDPSTASCTGDGCCPKLPNTLLTTEFEPLTRADYCSSPDDVGCIIPNFPVHATSDDCTLTLQELDKLEAHVATFVEGPMDAIDEITKVVSDRATAIGLLDKALKAVDKSLESVETLAGVIGALRKVPLPVLKQVGTLFHGTKVTIDRIRDTLTTPASTKLTNFNKKAAEPIKYAAKELQFRNWRAAELLAVARLSYSEYVEHPLLFADFTCSTVTECTVCQPALTARLAAINGFLDERHAELVALKESFDVVPFNLEMVSVLYDFDFDAFDVGVVDLLAKLDGWLDTDFCLPTYYTDILVPQWGVTALILLEPKCRTWSDWGLFDACIEWHYCGSGTKILNKLDGFLGVLDDLFGPLWDAMDVAWPTAAFDWFIDQLDFLDAFAANFDWLAIESWLPQFDVLPHFDMPNFDLGLSFGLPCLEDTAPVGLFWLDNAVGMEHGFCESGVIWNRPAAVAVDPRAIHGHSLCCPKTCPNCGVQVGSSTECGDDGECYTKVNTCTEEGAMGGARLLIHSAPDSFCTHKWQVNCMLRSVPLSVLPPLFAEGGAGSCLQLPSLSLDFLTSWLPTDWAVTLPDFHLPSVEIPSLVYPLVQCPSATRAPSTPLITNVDTTDATCAAVSEWLHDGGSPPLLNDIFDAPLDSTPGNGLTNGQYGRCQGDCDDDSDCASGLVCYQRSGTQEVPGCSGTGKSDWDYCIAPTATAPALDSSLGNGLTNGQYGRCQGDCDDDSDCAHGLTCFDRSGTQEVPGCSGTGTRNWDYCILDCTTPQRSEFTDALCALEPA